ncbi:MAG: hypothetical protein R3264_23025, partial [Anaerolineae bacterium]|nr:hypothetical protein [Anaerolineae bacterium]
RCQRFDFKRIRLDDIVQHLTHIVAQEGLTAEPAALEYVARQGNGSMRDAISLLDQLTAYGQETITLDLVQSVLGAVASQAVAELVEALINQDVASGLDIINQVTGDGTDPRQFAREIVEYLRSLMLVKLGNGADLLTLPEETLEILKTQAARVDGSTIVRATSLFNDASVDIKSGLLTIPQVPLELAFVEAAMPAPAPAAVEPVPTPAPPPQTPAVRAATPPPSPMPPPGVTESVAPTGGERTAKVESEITVDTVRACFDQVLKVIQRKNEIMANALRQAQLHRVSGREIHFVTSELMKRRFEKPQPKAAVDEAFSQVLGQAVLVHFLSEKNISSASQGDKANDEDIQALVKTAEELGGKLVS